MYLFIMTTKYTSLQIRHFRNLFWIRRFPSRKRHFGDWWAFWPYFHCACAETAISVPSFRSKFWHRH